MTTTRPAPAPGVDGAPASTRWRLVDSLRGFALCGILLVNVPDITRLGSAVPFDAEAPASTTQTLLEFAVQTRFVPIFVVLFGLSLQLVVDSARRRGTAPWLPVGLRLLALLGIGCLHAVVYPGEVLREYAVIGLLALPVVLWAPRWLTLALGAVGTVAAYALFGGGLASLPGLVLLGAAGASWGLPRALERGGRPVVATLGVAAVASVAAVAWQTTQPGDPRFTTAGGVAGLALAVTYTAALTLLWSTRARVVVAAAFEPLGRMALSNYVGASVVVVALSAGVPALDWAHMTSPLPAVVVALVVLTVQSVVSRAWLRHFRYGPVEWAWRTVTWRRRAPFRGGVL
jgi:uncharacterized membrane protein YeiB